MSDESCFELCRFLHYLFYCISKRGHKFYRVLEMIMMDLINLDYLIFEIGTLLKRKRKSDWPRAEDNSAKLCFVPGVERRT